MVPAICCIGHITVDHVITPGSRLTMPGGTAYYFSHAIANMPVRYHLVTAQAATEMPVVDELRARNIPVVVLPSDCSVIFENKYGNDLGQRSQRVLQKAAPFSAEQLMGVDAQIFHLGPLLADDFSLDAIRTIAEKGKISLDVQGFLRRVEATHVMAVDWKEKIAVLPVVHFLKASEEEMEVLTGCTNVFEGAGVLSAWGAREVIITGGSKGSVIYNGVDYTVIPAYLPQQETDATGCGDTYMAGYLFQRSSGASIQQAGEFASAMAALKIEKAGPFRGTVDDVNAVVNAGQRIRSRFIGV